MIHPQRVRPDAIITEAVKKWYQEQNVGLEGRRSGFEVPNSMCDLGKPLDVSGLMLQNCHINER